MWYVFQIGVFCAICWTDYAYHWHDHAKGDLSFGFIVLAGTWLATAAVAKAVDLALILKSRYRGWCHVREAKCRLR